MKVAELMELLQDADPEWEIEAAPLIAVSSTVLGTNPDETRDSATIADPTERYRIEQVMMFRSLLGSDRTEKLQLGLRRIAQDLDTIA